MAGDLRPAREKLERAREHREALAAEIESLIPYDPRFNPLRAYEAPMEYGDGTEFRFFVNEGPRIEATRCALILGDALFDLRSALDHIAYQLHVHRD